LIRGKIKKNRRDGKEKRKKEKDQRKKMMLR
jgi:hypothetical protein